MPGDVRAPKVLATICARGGSKGLRGKNIKTLHGKPLIQYTLECARRSARVDRFVVSTDSAEIINVVRSLGYDVEYRRPPELATDTIAKIDAIRHVTEFVEETHDFFPDIVVDLDIGVPLRQPEDVDRAVETLWQDPSMDAVVTVYHGERNPYFNMVQQSQTGYYELVKTATPPLVRRQDAPVVYSVTPAVFGWRRDRMNVTHLYEGRWGVVEMPIDRSVDIDTEFDFRLAELLMASVTRV
jgi:N-acylneuraminate cytidylyltransferase/CMP-N,N'-diacetyllegionaminic acid synthase